MSQIIIFIGSSDVDNIGDAILISFYCNAAIKQSLRSFSTLIKVNKGLCGLCYCIEMSGFPTKIIITEALRRV